MDLSSTPVSQHRVGQVLWCWLCPSTRSVMSTTCLPTCPTAHLPTCPPTHLPTCAPVCLFTCPPAHPLTCLPAHLLACLPACLPPAHLLTCSSVHLLLHPGTHPSFTHSPSHPLVLLIPAALHLLTCPCLLSACCLSFPRNPGKGLLALKPTLPTWRLLCLGQQPAASALLPDSHPEGGCKRCPPPPWEMGRGLEGPRYSRSLPGHLSVPGVPVGSSPLHSPVCGGLTGVGLNTQRPVMATPGLSSAPHLLSALCPDFEIFPSSPDTSPPGAASPEPGQGLEALLPDCLKSGSPMSTSDPHSPGNPIPQKSSPWACRAHPGLNSRWLSQGQAQGSGCCSSFPEILGWSSSCPGRGGVGPREDCTPAYTQWCLGAAWRWPAGGWKGGPCCFCRKHCR